MWSRVFQNLTALRLTGGIYRQTTYLLVVLCICVSAVCVAARLWWVILPLMAALFGLVFYALRRNFAFAESQPFAAVMEGPELLRLEELQRGQKDSHILAVSPPTIDHEPPREVPESEAAAPDSPALALPSDAGASR
jgi:hypothetical protein